MPSKPSDGDSANVNNEPKQIENGHSKVVNPEELSLTDHLNRKLLSSFLERVNSNAEFNNMDTIDSTLSKDAEDEFKA